MRDLVQNSLQSTSYHTPQLELIITTCKNLILKKLIFYHNIFPLEQPLSDINHFVPFTDMLNHRHYQQNATFTSQTPLGVA